MDVPGTRTVLIDGLPWVAFPAPVAIAMTDSILSGIRLSQAVRGDDAAAVEASCTQVVEATREMFSVLLETGGLMPGVDFQWPTREGTDDDSEERDRDGG